MVETRLTEMFEESRKGAGQNFFLRPDGFGVKLFQLSLEGFDLIFDRLQLLFELFDFFQLLFVAYLLICSL